MFSEKSKMVLRWMRGCAYCTCVSGLEEIQEISFPSQELQKIKLQKQRHMENITVFKSIVL